jgi:hypothetical protein
MVCRGDSPDHAQVWRASAIARMKAEANEARRAMAGVIVLSSTQPGTTRHSSGKSGKIPINPPDQPGEYLDRH